MITEQLAREGSPTSAPAIEPSRQRNSEWPILAANGPQAKATEHSRPATSGRPSSASKLKILVADDEPLLTFTLAEILQDAGFTVETVADGKAAVQAAEIMRPDLLLTDVMMPKMNGIEAAKTIKSFLPECRIILISGQASTGDLLRKAEEEGHRFEIITKPISPDALLALLRPPEE